MDKKTACCGCGCLFIIVVTIAIIVGGYYGLDSIHSFGKNAAAEGFESSMNEMTAMAFGDADKAEIDKASKQVVEDIRSGKIGLLNLFEHGTKSLKDTIHIKTMLLAFQKNHLMKAEDGLQGEQQSSAIKSVSRLLYGLSEKRISSDQVASIPEILLEKYSTTTTTDSGMKVTSRKSRMKLKFTQEELSNILEMINKTCDLNEIEQPDASFDPVISVKKEILNIFANMKNPSEVKAEVEK